jgi:hypothetical protein
MEQFDFSLRGSVRLVYKGVSEILFCGSIVLSCDKVDGI